MSGQSKPKSAFSTKYSSDYDVVLQIPIKSVKQLQLVRQAEELLLQAGVAFDTGTGFGNRDWMLDFSLRGAKVIARRKEDR